MNAETTHKPMRRREVRLSAADTAELREILALPHIAAMTPQERIVHAQTKLADATANYRGWATNPTNERVFISARRTVETLENAVVLLQIAAGGDVEETESAPDDLPLETPDFPQKPTVEPEPKSELRRAREACFASVCRAGLPSDTSMIRAAYTNYFQEWAGNTTTKWTVAQWVKMTNAVNGKVWKSESGRWVRVHCYTGQITRRAA